MARLNVYVPDDLAPIVDRWRERVNLSEICTTALRESLEALESGRSIGPLLDHLREPTDLESELAARFGLHRAIVARESAAEQDERQVVAAAAAEFLDRTLAAEMTLGIAGGRQMWEIVRRIRPRPLRVRLVAIGAGQVDPTVLHAHPNTLVTLLWLLWAPRAVAHLVGASAFERMWRADEKETPELRRVLIGSCSAFDPDAPYPQLLGKSVRTELRKHRAAGDFMGVFLNRRGRPINVGPPPSASLVDAEALGSNARRSDTVVAVAAGGAAKLTMIRLTLAAGLCNTLVTDVSTARSLAN
jgi:DNA-binding transcriptional regulator LsrR (DeoR family)